MIRHIHFSTDNTNLTVTVYLKYKNFIDVDDNYRFMNELSFDSAQVELFSHSLNDLSKMIEVIVEDLFNIKKHFTKAITFSRTQLIEHDDDLRNATDEILHIMNEYVTSEEYL